ncbi:MAG: transporter substrate-binding protein [Verrucomicrobiales bacterium]|nr:transporter substrate-binding protein [Verrucomicrobiales bacterium]
MGSFATPMNLRISRKRFLLGLPLASVAIISCKKSEENAPSNASARKKVRIGYMGLTCEAPIYVAKEYGFFEKEGVDVELVRTEWTQFKDLLNLGKIDLGQQPVMMFLKPIEEGLDVKMTAGVHKGCLRIQAGVNGKIKAVADLRGKRIGVPGMGTPPFIFANRVLSRNKIDPKTEVEWRVFPSGELALAMEKGEVDAVATSEPIGSLLLAEGKVRNIADLGVDPQYANEYCCSIMLNGKFATGGSRDTCAAAVRAILKGAKWVETNPRAAAKMSVEKGYLASNPELNAKALGALRFTPSVSGGREAIQAAAQDMMAIGMLSATTDVAAVTKRIFVEFDGVTDEWLKTLQVETVADGQIPGIHDAIVARELETEGPPVFAETCCSARSRIARAEPR